MTVPANQKKRSSVECGVHQCTSEQSRGKGAYVIVDQRTRDAVSDVVLLPAALGEEVRGPLAPGAMNPLHSLQCAPSSLSI